MCMVSYLSLLPNWRRVLFGLVNVFFSAPGQTFFVALFIPSIIETFGFSVTQFATLYSIATLFAAVVLSVIAPALDRFSARYVNIVVVSGLSVGCILLSHASHWLVLSVALVLLRLFGQGATTLAASTYMGKWFGRNRGKALSCITLGYPFSELVFPGLALLGLSVLGWRQTYLLLGVTLLILMWPIQHYLLRGTTRSTQAYIAGESLDKDATLDPDSGAFSLTHILRSYSFYLILFAACIPPTLMTGLLFHQYAMLSYQGWPLSALAVGLSVYGIAKAIMTLSIGPLIDRYGPTVPFSLLILLLGVATMIVSLRCGEIVLYVFFALSGAALGMSGPVMNVVWPLIYGTKVLGRLKGVVGMCRNGGTALAPLPLAYIVDQKGPFLDVMFAAGFCVALVSLLPFGLAKWGALQRCKHYYSS